MVDLSPPDSHPSSARTTGGRGCVRPSRCMRGTRATLDGVSYGARGHRPRLLSARRVERPRPGDSTPRLRVTRWKAASPLRSATALQRTQARYRDSPRACLTTGVVAGSALPRTNTPFNVRQTHLGQRMQRHTMNPPRPISIRLDGSGTTTTLTASRNGRWLTWPMFWNISRVCELDATTSKSVKIQPRLLILCPAGSQSVSATTLPPHRVSILISPGQFMFPAIA